MNIGSSYSGALEDAGAQVLAFEQFGDYQGSWFAKVSYDGSEFWVVGGYGSCSGCDALEAEFGYGNAERCGEHKYSYGEVPGCAACAKQQEIAATAWIDFGKSYLTDRRSASELIEEYEKNKDWDSDANSIIEFIKAN